MASKKLFILDFSVYGNSWDPLSDNLLAEAAMALGYAVEVVPSVAGAVIEPDGEYIWLRYDLRSPQDLAWIVDLGQRLLAQGYAVFPPPRSILLSEDKWKAYGSFCRLYIPTPVTFLGSDIEQCGFPAIVKPRVGWGGMGLVVLDCSEDRAVHSRQLDENHICQRFIMHDRTYIEAMECGREIACVEELKSGSSGETRESIVPSPPDAARLSASALHAVGLPAGTVDLIETPSGLVVLEVNSAPCLVYPDLHDLDLAGPMMEAVLAGMRSA